MSSDYYGAIAGELAGQGRTEAIREARCTRGCPEGECYCAEPSSDDPAYTGICRGCGGYEECYCGEPG